MIKKLPLLLKEKRLIDKKLKERETGVLIDLSK